MIAPTSFFADYGCHVRILEEVGVLQRAGHQVTLCTYHNGNDVAGLTIKRSLNVPWRKGVQVGSSRHKLYFDAMLAIKSVQVALQLKPDIIHAHLHEGALIGFPLKLLQAGRVPLIFDYQGSLTHEMVDHHFLRKDGPFYKPTHRLEKLINQVADTIITSSYNAATVLREQFNCPPSKVVTITDGISGERFRPHTTPTELEATLRLKQELGIPFDRKVVVYLGLLAPYQGTNLLLEAAQIIKQTRQDVHFVIMGYPGVDSYRELAQYLKVDDCVVFPGRIPYQEAPRYLALGDVAVAPKMSVTEGAGKIPSYMAMELPTITFDSPVSREFLGDLGIYAEMGNVQSLADKILLGLSPQVQHSGLGHDLRLRVLEKFSLEQARQQIEAVYQDNIARLRKPRATQLVTRPTEADFSQDLRTHSKL
jgi:glycosyltransferase involved in cell wall biosynthesis